MNIFVIMAALIILLILTLKKVPIIISALLSAVFMAVCSGMPVFETIAAEYMEGLADFVRSTWLMFLLGTVLSSLMDHTGAAASIARFTVRRFGAKWAIPAVIISGGLLTYGGISAFVACYALYPVTLMVFREADLPEYLMPAVICAGIHTWVNMLPGNPSVTNIVPVAYLNTTAKAAPVVGVIAAVLTLTLTFLYFAWEVRKAEKRGDRFSTDEKREKMLKKMDALEKEKGLPDPFMALLPVLCVAVVMNVLKQDISIALSAGILLCSVLFGRNFRGGREILSNAVAEASFTLITAASVVGIGNVIRATPGFQKIAELILRFGEVGVNPFVIFAVAVAVMSGMNASATSGLSTILSALGEPFLRMGIPAELLHRVGVIAAIGPGGLPHSGGMVAVLEVCGVSYKEGYRHLFVAVVMIPMATLLAVLAGMV